MVPGSTLRYGSSLRKRTLYPRACSRAPSAAEARPFPREETTPPVMKINRAMEGQHGESGAYTPAESSIGPKCCEPFGKYRQKRVRNWDSHPCVYRLCNSVVSRLPRRVDEDAISAAWERQARGWLEPAPAPFGRVPSGPALAPRERISRYARAA